MRQKSNKRQRKKNEKNNARNPDIKPLEKNSTILSVPSNTPITSSESASTINTKTVQISIPSLSGKIRHLDNLIKPMILFDKDLRCKKSKKIGTELGFRHPAKRYLSTLGKSFFHCDYIVTLLFCMWFTTKSVGALILFSISLLWVFLMFEYGIRQFIRTRLMRTHIFLGYPFSSVGEKTFYGRIQSHLPSINWPATSPLAASVGHFLWPVWGVTSVIPPMRQKNKSSDTDEETGARGSPTPYTLRVRKDDEWEECVERLIAQCELAIFDVRENPIGKGLQREISIAQRTMDENRIAFIERNATGQTIIRVGNEVREPCNLDPSNGGVSKPSRALLFLHWVANKFQIKLPYVLNPHDPRVRAKSIIEFSIIFLIIHWASDLIPINKREYFIRRTFHRIDYVLIRLSVYLSYIAIAVIPVGILILVIEMINSMMKLAN